MLVIPIEVTVEVMQMFILESKQMERPKSEPWEPLTIQRQGTWSGEWSSREQCHRSQGRKIPEELTLDHSWPYS